MFIVLQLPLKIIIICSHKIALIKPYSKIRAQVFLIKPSLSFLIPITVVIDGVLFKFPSIVKEENIFENPSFYLDFIKN